MVKSEGDLFPPTIPPTSPSGSRMDVDCKTEGVPKLSSQSRSPTLDMPSRLSPTPTPPPQSAYDGQSTNGTASKASTPPLKQQQKPGVTAIQLISDLPIARQAALASFNEISDNNYQYKTLGRSRELLESMTCDCSYEHGIDSEDMACGPYSDCINRLTQVECLEGDCRCRSYCQNQRFQHKQYANIEIVLTEKKGYGLRAEEDLPKDTFIYEYVGDVVNPISFKKRMRDYAQEGIQHFYFMMLQKDEFIDATKNGGIGRFANHSCNPNCFVAKWSIGDGVRMGIFAKRLIRKHEELTFNYNVDRYGHQAQTCYCGEPNCVGYIGGKTQTEFAAMDDLYLDALGITDENELMELKGTRKRKGKKIDDPDFMPTMKPVVEKDIPKVVQAIRQTTSRKMLSKILTRIKMTEDQAALRQLMRLRGYSIMTNVLNDFKEDLEIVFLALECMETWPLMNKNKVEDSRVFVPIEEFAKLEDEKVKTMAQKLLDHWNTLPTYNRIPKRLITAVESGRGSPQPAQNDDDQDHLSRREQEIKRARMEEEERAHEIQRRVRAIQETQRQGHPVAVDQKKLASVNADLMTLQREKWELHAKEQARIHAIINSVTEARAMAAAAAATDIAERKAKEEYAALKAAKRKEEKERKQKKQSEENKAAKEANKEKRLLKLVGAVVVKSMSKYAKGLGKDDFKKHAKELTHLIADKEKKSLSYKDSRLEALSDEKVTKIKKFCREYITKLLRKLEKSGGKLGSNSNGRGHHGKASSADTPNSGFGDTEAENMEMSVEEALGEEGEEEDYGSDNPQNHDQGSPDPTGTQSSPPSSAAPTPSTSHVPTSDSWRDEENMANRWDDWQQDRMGPDRWAQDFEPDWS